MIAEFLSWSSAILIFDFLIFYILTNIIIENIESVIQFQNAFARGKS
jgi:hypothetical protein